MDVDMFRKAVFSLMYNEPHLRTDVDLDATPALWIPATDFSEVFHFEDLRESGAKSVADVWHVVEKETNHQFKFGSGKPLYKCSLMRINGGYIVNNIYHHGAADGTSGLLMMGEIMKQYKLLEEGKDLVKKPHQPRGPMEELVKPQLDLENETTTGIVKGLVAEKTKRDKEWKPLLPFDMNEHEENKSGEFINKILFSDGTKENYTGIRARCKAEGVSVGSIALAASYMAMAEIHATSSCSDMAEYQGMKEQYMDIPVNIRQRLDDVNEDEYCGFYVTEVTFKCDVTLETKLWDLARNIQGQLKTIIAEDQHLLFSKVKEEWETSEETKDLAISSWQEGKISDVIVSNLMFYKYPTDLGWGEINSLYCSVSVAIPFCSNLELLFQACSGKFTYTLVYCPGKNNEKSANDYMDAFVKMMETSHLENGTQSLKEFLTSSS